MYERLGRTVIKFPGGTQKVDSTRNDQTPGDTLRAEISEEVLESGTVVQALQIYVDMSKPEHTKHFFLIEVDGEMRKDGKIDQEPGKPDEMLSPPFFLETEELWERIFLGHKNALEEIIRHMARTDEAWGWIAHKLSITS